MLKNTRRRTAAAVASALTAAALIAVAPANAAPAPPINPPSSPSQEFTETGHCIWPGSTKTATASYTVTPSTRYGDASDLRRITFTNYGNNARVKITITSSDTGKTIALILKKAPTGKTKTINAPTGPRPVTIPWGSTLKATFTTGGQRCTLTLGM